MCVIQSIDEVFEKYQKVLLDSILHAGVKLTEEMIGDTNLAFSDRKPIGHLNI